jgi:hypothetical protein
MPGDLCVQCTGWRKNWSRELGEWEVAQEDGKEIEPELVEE